MSFSSFSLFAGEGFAKEDRPPRVSVGSRSSILDEILGPSEAGHASPLTARQPTVLENRSRVNAWHEDGCPGDLSLAVRADGLRRVEANISWERFKNETKDAKNRALETSLLLRGDQLQAEQDMLRKRTLDLASREAAMVRALARASAEESAAERTMREAKAMRAEVLPEIEALKHKLSNSVPKEFLQERESQWKKAYEQQQVQLKQAFETQESHFKEELDAGYAEQRERDGYFRQELDAVRAEEREMRGYFREELEAVQAEERERHGYFREELEAVRAEEREIKTELQRRLEHMEQEHCTTLRLKDMKDDRKHALRHFLAESARDCLVAFLEVWKQYHDDDRYDYQRDILVISPLKLLRKLKFPCRGVADADQPPGTQSWAKINTMVSKQYQLMHMQKYFRLWLSPEPMAWTIELEPTRELSEDDIFCLENAMRIWKNEVTSDAFALKAALTPMDLLRTLKLPRRGVETQEQGTTTLEEAEELLTKQYDAWVISTKGWHSKRVPNDGPSAAKLAKRRMDAAIEEAARWRKLEADRKKRFHELEEEARLAHRTAAILKHKQEETSRRPTMSPRDWAKVLRSESKSPKDSPRRSKTPPNRLQNDGSTDIAQKMQPQSVTPSTPRAQSGRKGGASISPTQSAREGRLSSRSASQKRVSFTPQ
eukprot:TRINITY_DN25908_c0_g1_i1.p1 TRINITY_DN25908_c0_g1~~TRINITY_DN25908_c0_g1_i1.p1  ORF type:complete len:660 (-),score=115.67 TRINITY_DN25908_c0_g1_i1:285-2264(-)